VRGVVKHIGFDSYVDDQSIVDSKGLCDKTCEALLRINEQSPNIAGGVHVGKDDMDAGAGVDGQPAITLFGDQTHMYITPRASS
jgi:S-adenosylmethionine synthetase